METKDLKTEVLIKDPGDFDLSFKLIFIGDSGVGKSCLAARATKDNFDPLYSPTIGFEFMTFFVKIEDTIIKLQIWDTCGQEVYRSLISSFYRNSSLAILVYAINNDMSFNNLNIWLNEVRTFGNPDINLFLIGNKVDIEDDRQISKEEAQKFAENNKVKLFLETSAKTGYNAKNVLVEAAKLLYGQHLIYQNKLSRPESLKSSTNSTNNVELETVEEESNKKRRKCC